jgi:FkbM family methyltransferase
MDKIYMLYLTYNNSFQTDGAGAQLQRIISIYLIAQKYKLKYFHSPLKFLSYQGLECLEKNESDSRQLNEYNTLFSLPSDTLPEKYEVYNEIYLYKNTLERYIQLAKTKDILLQIAFAHTLIDNEVNILNYNLPFTWVNSKLNTPIQIAIHIRRGELLVVDSNRMLPNEYYISCMEALSAILEKENIKYEFHIHTEQLTMPLTVTPSHHGICNRITENIILYPEDNFKELFNKFSNVIFHINEYPVKTLVDLTNSDILLGSRSSFSYIAAIMKKKGCILFHPFCHGLSTNWIPTKSVKDIFDNSTKIVDKLMLKNTSQIIPRNIIQIALGDEYIQKLPLDTIKRVLKEANKEFSYTLLTDNECISFLRNFFPQYLPLYNNLVRPQYKSDLVRYLYLYKYGGYYVDIDLCPILSFYKINELTNYSSSFFTIGAHSNFEKGVYEMANGFCGSAPNNSIFLELIELMEEEANPDDYGKNVKRMFSCLNKYYKLNPFTQSVSSNKFSTYFFKEENINGKYYITNKNINIYLSNGSGYPYSVPELQNNFQSVIFINDDNEKIVVDNSLEYAQTFIERVHKEPMFRRIISYFITTRIINPNKNIIDLGAWIGDNSIIWAKKIKGDVYAIDPSESNCKFIDTLSYINNVTNCKTIQKAISNEKEILSTNESLHHCSFVYGNTGVSGMNKVESTTLDALEDEGEITDIGFIHLDVEGMEEKVVQGAKRIIQKNRPIVAYEIHLELDPYIQSLAMFFKVNNYNVLCINEILPGCRPDCRNFLAIPESIFNGIDIDDLCKRVYCSPDLFISY